MSDFDLGRYYCANPHHALLHHVLECVVGRYPRRNYLGASKNYTTEYGMALEFGVGDGASLRCIAQWMGTLGFDSFEGLPEDWRPGFDKGAFRHDPPTDLPSNTGLVTGLFEDTMPGLEWNGVNIRLVHIDCDLYSSTKTVLENLPWDNMITNKAVIIFDEFWNYPEAELHEQRAWKEYSSANTLEYRVIGSGIQQWGIQLV